MSTFNVMKQVLDQLEQQERHEQISKVAKEKYNLAEIEARLAAYAEAHTATFPFVQEFLARELRNCTNSMQKLFKMVAETSPELGDLLMTAFEANMQATFWGTRELLFAERDADKEDLSEETPPKSEPEH